MKKKTNDTLLQQWKSGPLSDKVLTPGHGRGIFCMSLFNDNLVTGSADHGLRVYSMQDSFFILNNIV